MIADAELIAYVDNELPSERRLAIEAAVAADPTLERRLERHRRLRRLVGLAFDDVLSEPVPERLTAIITDSRIAAPVFGRPRVPVGKWFAVGLPMAASLAVGVFAGRGLVERETLLRPSAVGGMQATGELSRALDNQLSTQAGSPVQVGFSFVRADGAVCRTFILGERPLAGLACRTDGGWAVPVVAEARRPAGSEYRTASSETPPEVLAAVDRLIAGEALDAEGERRARANGWRLDQPAERGTR